MFLCDYPVNAIAGLRLPRGRGVNAHCKNSAKNLEMIRYWYHIDENVEAVL
jgi:hypothetical protein